MSKDKIISNYILEDIDKKEKNINIHKAPSVIKIPIIEKNDKKILSETSSSNLKEPILKLSRNSEGVVVGIEVQCTCGETILIKMDY
ncbi:MAG: hypothetical protein PHY08_00715 [Candidatus Cloacimonetes bacterium]|jgi:hypothetical protein|nr:hypothetical protein [Candidatus Cloacimonadota bacterium]MDD4155076.1 hypothetical protein [Candidatus Cloacimonadota bacterium]